MTTRKRPKTSPAPAFAEDVAKSLAAPDLSVIDNRRFTWSFGSIDWDGPFGFRHITPEDLAAVIRLLAEVEYLSGSELERKGYKAIPINHLSPAAQERLAALQMGGMRQSPTGLREFRIGPSKRLWCIQRGQKHLALLWWDPRHEVYLTRGSRRQDAR